MKLNDLAFSINIGDAQLCHQCAAKQARSRSGLVKGTFTEGQGEKKDPGNL